MSRRLLTGWPYSSSFRRVRFCGTDAAIHADQPIVWIVVAPFEATRIAPDTHRYFPAVLDTGFAGRVLLNHRHLTAWAGVGESDLRLEPKTETVYGQVLPRLQLKAWLLTTDPILNTASAYQHAFPLRIRDGITVVTKATATPWNQRPELPLLGMRLLADNFLTLTVHGLQRTIDLQTDRRW
jgi:hypothetical protein